MGANYRGILGSSKGGARVSEVGYFLAGAGIGLAVGFHSACMTIKKLIKDEPEKFAQIFKNK